MAGRRDLIAYFRGVDELTPVMNRINGGLTNTARISDTASTRMAGMGGMLSREWDRFQRSFGHAISYAAIYKLYEAYNNLKNFNSELGTLSAMLPNAGRGVDELGNVALRISTQTGAPLNDVQESINNIIQSIPNMAAATRTHLVPAMAEIEAMASRITDVDPRSFGSTVLSLATAFYGRQRLADPQGGPRLLEQIASQLVTTRFTTPRLTGQDITQFIPTLTGGAIAGGFSLPQTLALFTVAQRSIGRPAQSAQYLRQLMIRLRNPTHAEAPFFAQAGLGPQELSNMTGMQVLNRLIQHGLALPGGASQEQVRSAMTTGNWRGINVTGQSAQFFRQSIGGRIQSLVAIDALVRNLGQVTMQMDTLRKGSQDLERDFDRWRQRNSLQIMSNALSNATTDILQNLMPGLSVASDQLTGFAGHIQTFSEHMRGWDRRVGLGIQRHLGFGTRNNVIGGALDFGLTVGGVAALMRGGSVIRALRGSLSGGRLGRLFGRRAAEGELLEGRVGTTLLKPFTAAYTAEAALAGIAGQANGTPSQPFWVVIHPLSQTTVPGLFGNSSTSTKPGGGLENKIKQSIWSRIKGVVGGAAGGGAVAARNALRAGAGAALRGAGAGVEGAGGLLARVPGGPLGGLGAGLGIEALIALAFPDQAGPTNRGLGYGEFNLNRLFPNTNFQQLGVLRRLASGRNAQTQFGRSRAVEHVMDRLVARQISPQVAERQLEILLRSYAGHHPGAHPFAPQRANAASRRFNQQMNSFWGGRGSNISAAQGQALLAGDISATLRLEPTQEFRNLLRPQKVRHKVPVSLWDTSASPPTERGKAKVTRNRG